MKTIIPSKLAKAAIVSSSILALVAGTQAAIVYSANFTGMSTAEDGEINQSGNESDASDVNQINAKAGASDLTWQSLRLGYPNIEVSSYQSILSIVDVGTNQALLVSGAGVGGNKYKGVMAKFPTPATLTNVGDFISINFVGQFAGAPGEFGSGLRFGFMTSTSEGLDSLVSLVGTGGNTGLSTLWGSNKRLGEYNTPMGSTSAVSSVESGTEQSLGETPFEISFKVELVSAGKYEITTIVDNGDGVTEPMKLVRSITDAENRNFSALDSFAIRTQEPMVAFGLDDIVITYVPEPTVPLMLGSLLCGTLLYRRRV